MSHDEKADTPKGNRDHNVGNLLQDLSIWLRSKSDDNQVKEGFKSQILPYINSLLQLTKKEPIAYGATLKLQELLDDYINSPTNEKYKALVEIAGTIK